MSEIQTEALDVPKPSSSHKIISEFSLCEAEKAKLAACLKENLDALASDNPVIQVPAMGKLKETLRDTLPKEALAELEKTLKTGSEYAWLIHNLPENDTFDFVNTPYNRSQNYKKNEYAQSMYSFHIGQALYDMFGIDSKELAPAFRINPNRPERKSGKTTLYTGAFIHRDFAPLSIIDMETASSYSAFSSSHNGEKAPTGLFMVEDAIKNLPEDVRQRTRAVVEFRQLEGYGEGRIVEIMTLAEILANLEDPAVNKTKTISIIEPRNEASEDLKNNPADINRFLDEIEKVSVKKTLNKGDLLVFCEDRIFHQGYPGDPEATKLIPPENLYSRTFFHHAGMKR